MCDRVHVNGFVFCSSVSTGCSIDRSRDRCSSNVIVPLTSSEKWVHSSKKNEPYRATRLFNRTELLRQAGRAASCKRNKTSMLIRVNKNNNKMTNGSRIICEKILRRIVTGTQKYIQAIEEKWHEKSAVRCNSRQRTALKKGLSGDARPLISSSTSVQIISMQMQTGNELNPKPFVNSTEFQFRFKWKLHKSAAAA